MEWKTIWYNDSIVQLYIRLRAGVLKSKKGGLHLYLFGCIIFSFFIFFTCNSSKNATLPQAFLARNILVQINDLISLFERIFIY